MSGKSYLLGLAAAALWPITSENNRPISDVFFFKLNSVRATLYLPTAKVTYSYSVIEKYALTVKPINKLVC